VNGGVDERLLELSRPSLIRVEVRAETVRISGGGVVVATGVMTL
jgi:predicted PhzF superfamily epimerase YddE/YHI9